ncbi:MAG: radical SAM protein [Candidatus Omnitrophica bacterium]|nr:radical SAM protein [Candidatus Omnitrophota bacterium]
MKVYLCNPPTGYYIRDERCQIDVNSRVAENIREPIQILYLGGLLQKYDYEILIRDYSFSVFSIKNVLSDILEFKPDCIYIETTQGTFKGDLKFIDSLVNTKKDIFFIIKAPFLDEQYLKEQILENNFKSKNKIFFILRSFEITVLEILKNRGKIVKLDNTFVLNDSEIVTSKGKESVSGFDMDEYPIPPRNFLNKNNYLRPDTNEPIAYIYTSKGCPQNCIFCSAPLYLGRKVQTRSVDKIIEEVKDCIENYKINNFFFRSDSFTFNKKWVMEFCGRVIDEKLKINWGANSRVDVFDEKMFKTMKNAGCDVVGFGVESCSNEILKKIRKDIRLSDIERIHKLVKQIGIKTFLHCIIGFPWDNKTTILETKNKLIELNPDFIEVNVPYPLKGTELYEIADKHELFISKNFEDFSHVNPILRTLYLQPKEILRMRRDLLFSFYFRKEYIVRKIKESKSTKVFFNYMKWGLKLTKKMMAR